MELDIFETSATQLDLTSIAFNILTQNIFENIDSRCIPSGVKLIHNDNEIQQTIDLSKKQKKMLFKMIILIQVLFNIYIFFVIFYEFLRNIIK